MSDSSVLLPSNQKEAVLYPCTLESCSHTCQDDSQAVLIPLLPPARLWVEWGGDEASKPQGSVL